MAKTPVKKVNRKPDEFVSKKGTKPGAVRKAEKADVKQDKAIASKFGVRFAGHKP